MIMGRRADGLKADDPFFALSIHPSCRLPWPTSGPVLGRGGYRNGYHPTCQPTQTRQARRQTMRPGDRALQGVPHAHTKQNNSHTHLPYRAGNCQPGRQLCCAVPRCVLCWCCAVMWLLHPLSASPVFQRGGPPWPPILFLTSHSIFDLLRRSFLPCTLACLSLSAWLPAWVCVFSHRSSGKVRASSLWLQADELIQQWQAVGDKACQSGPAVPQPSPSSWPCWMRP